MSPSAPPLFPTACCRPSGPARRSPCRGVPASGDISVLPGAPLLRQPDVGNSAVGLRWSGLETAAGSGEGVGEAGGVGAAALGVVEAATAAAAEEGRGFGDGRAD